MLIRTRDNEEIEAFDQTHQATFSVFRGTSLVPAETHSYAVEKSTLRIYRQVTYHVGDYPEVGPWALWEMKLKGRTERLANPNQGYLPDCTSDPAKQLRKKLAEAGEWSST